MSLFSEESVIMNLIGHIEKNKDRKNQFYNPTDYILKLSIKALKADKEVEEKFEIQMITKDSQ